MAARILLRPIFMLIFFLLYYITAAIAHINHQRKHFMCLYLHLSPNFFNHPYNLDKSMYW